MTERISGELAVCPCADKFSCPECNGSMPVGERLRRRHARMTGPECVELFTRLNEMCDEVDDDELETTDGRRA